MGELKNNEKISLIKKYYKKNPSILDLTMINYEGYNFYITLNEIKKKLAEIGLSFRQGDE